MADKQTEAILRSEVAESIKEHIEATFSNVRLWVDHEKVGPLGGVSSVVFGAVGGEEGGVLPVCVSVYSDDRIRAQLESKLEECEKDDELRKRLGWA